MKLFLTLLNLSNKNSEVRETYLRVFNCYDLKKVNLLAWFLPPLKHFHKHKLCLQNTFNPFCCCCNGEIDFSLHYLLLYLLYLKERPAFLNGITWHHSTIVDWNYVAVTHILLFGTLSLNNETKTGILNACLYNFNRKIQEAIVHQQLMRDKVLVG